MCPITHAPHHPCSTSRFIHYYDNVPHHPCALLLMWPIGMCPITLLPCRPRRVMPHCPYAPITPVPHHPCAQSPYPLCSCAPLPMCSIAYVAYCTCTPLPYSHVDLEFHMPHCPYAPSPLFPWVMGHTGDGAAKCQMMSSCQKDVKCQKIKYHDYGVGSKKKLTY